MAQVFRRSMNTVSRVAIVAAVMAGGAVPVLAYVINKSPNETLVRVVREQPVPFSHEHHVRGDRKSTRLNSSHSGESRMPSSA